MAFKLVISDPKTGFTVQKEVADDAVKGFLGLKIGDSLKGELIDLQGYEFALTGGSDYCGFPMRKDVQGSGRKQILSYQGTGFRKDRKGMLQRKTVCGNTVHDRIAQLNVMVMKAGASDIFAEVRKKKEEKGKSAANDEKAAAAETAPAEGDAGKSPAKEERSKAPEEKEASAPKEKPAKEEKPAPSHEATKK